MSLLPEEWQKEWVAVCATTAGEGIHPRYTLRIGDILLRRKEYRADGSAMSLSVWPRMPHPDVVLVGRDIFPHQLYPDLWGDWEWVD